MRDFYLIDNLPTISIAYMTNNIVGIIVKNTEEIQHFPTNSIFTVYRGYAKLKLKANEIENRDKLLEVWTPNETN